MLFTVSPAFSASYLSLQKASFKIRFVGPTGCPEHLLVATFKTGSIGCPVPSATNCQYMPLNVPEASRSLNTAPQHVGLHLLKFSVDKKNQLDVTLCTLYLSSNRSSASQGIPRILWKPKIHYRFHNSQPPVPNLSQLHPTCG